MCVNQIGDKAKLSERLLYKCKCKLFVPSREVSRQTLPPKKESVIHQKSCENFAEIYRNRQIQRRDVVNRNWDLGRELLKLLDNRGLTFLTFAHWFPYYGRGVFLIRLRISEYWQSQVVAHAFVT